jgi:hypothetical protein
MLAAIQVGERGGGQPGQEVRQLPRSAAGQPLGELAQRAPLRRTSTPEYTTLKHSLSATVLTKSSLFNLKPIPDINSVYSRGSRPRKMSRLLAAWDYLAQP